MSDQDAGARAEARDQMRGSATLLSGRVISLGVNFATKVIIVRGLTKGEFGAFAYGFAMIPAVRALVSVGQNQALGRFLSIFLERREPGKLVGSIVAVCSTVALLGTAIALALLVVESALLAPAIGDAVAARALTILILLAPLEALDRINEAALATLSRPTEIFIRRYIVGPGVILAAAATTLALGGGPIALAYAYVAAATVSTLIFVALTVRALRQTGLLADARRAGIELPFRELYGFSAPLLSTELLPLVLGPVAAGIVGYVGSTSDVASYRAVYPVARLNQSVIFTFTILYIPLASRLYERADHRRAADVYWRTATWLLLLSVPALIVTLPFAEPVTTLLFGAAYRSSGIILALMSLGYFLNVSSGFNSQTLQIHGHVRFLVITSAASAIVSVGAMLALAPGFGPAGVAAGVALGLGVQNLANQIGLARLTGIPALTRSYVRLVVRVLALLVALRLWQVQAPPPLALGVGVGLVAAVGLVLVERDRLRLMETFPELERIPGLRRLVA